MSMKMRLIPRFPDVLWKQRPKKVITMYGIRRKGDGFYMPQPKGKGGRGGSFMEPEDPILLLNEVRLFHSESTAKSALAQWCRGKHYHIVRNGVKGHRFFDDTEPDERTDIDPVPGRNKDDFDIVPIKVHLP